MPMSRWTHLSSGMDLMDNIHQVAHGTHGIPQKALFADAERMKKNLRENILNKPPYDVSMYYKKHGFAQKVARHRFFERVTLSVITFNALWLWIDADYNKEETLNEASPVFQAVEFFFCAYFLTEWIFRFLSFDMKCDCLKDPWFVFDSCLVLIMIVDTGVMYTVVAITGSGGGGMGNIAIVRLARLLRLLRMCRMVRLLHAMPEILILIKGMCAAMRSVFFTLCLLLILIYVFGIIFRQLCDQEDNPLREEFFTTVPKTMHTLLIHGTFMDSLTDLVLPLENYNFGLLLIFYGFLLLAALTVMNMLIGVLCEVVSAVAATEKEGMSICYVQDRLKHLLYKSDDAGAQIGMISKAEFLRLLHQPNAVKVLQEVGVDAVGLIDFVDFIFQEDMDMSNKKQDKNRRMDHQSTDNHPRMDHQNTDFQDHHKKGCISFNEFVEVVLSLRGDNYARVKDSVELRKYVKLCTDSAVERLTQTLKGGVGKKVGAFQSTSSLPTVTDRYAVGNTSNSVLNPSAQVPASAEPVDAGVSQQGVERAVVEAPHARPSLRSQQGDLPKLELPPAYSTTQFLSFRQAAGQLFDQLVERHEREVAALQDENSRLRSLLELPGGEASKGVPPARASTCTDSNVLVEQRPAVAGAGVSTASEVAGMSALAEQSSTTQPPVLSQQPLPSNEQRLPSAEPEGEAFASGVLRLSSANPAQLAAWANPEPRRSQGPDDGQSTSLRLSRADPAELAAWCDSAATGQCPPDDGTLRLSSIRSSQLRSWCEVQEEHGRSRDEHGFLGDSTAVSRGEPQLEDTEGKIAL